MNAIFNMKKLSIQTRLFLGFSSLVIPILLMVVFFIVKINNIESYLHKRAEVIVPIKVLSSKMDAELYETFLITYEWLLTRDITKRNQLNHAWDVIDDTQDEIKRLLPKSDNLAYLHSWQALMPLYPELRTLQNKLLLDNISLTSEQIRQIFDAELRPISDKMFDLIRGARDSSNLRKNGLFELQLSELSQGANNIVDGLSTLHFLTYCLFFLTIILAFCISFITARKILKPIKAYSDYSSKIATGDLSQRITIERDDELGALGNDLNTMTEGLSSLTRKITEASDNMTSMLDEVRNASDMQSTGISEQASSINEITASLEEIDKSTTQTMDKAKILGQVSEQTSQKGQMGLTAVEQSINGMKSIHDKVQTIAQTILELSNQTQQIGEITTVVNTLALQSKMLALNASIEAAKAGEAGKGFAIVAAEVKNLAEQSEQSTTQVQKILEDIRHGTEKAVIVTEEGAKGVAEGTVVVQQMGDIMQSLTEAINETMLASQQIEVAVRQESLGIEQITVGMNEINQVTSSFVSTVQDTNELITKLGGTAQKIKDYVNKYKI